ncbi:hypothetical protein BN1723_017691, partial [Verticillium longisporum]
DQPEAAVRRL